MDKLAVLTVFANRFVVADFRDRFLHEAMKKPRKLNSRICHAIWEVIPQQYKNTMPKFAPNTECLFLDNVGFVVMTWAEAMALAKTGGGNLIVDHTGLGFFANTEGQPPPEFYGHGA